MNVLGTVNVLEAVRAERPEARVLVVSTGEVYGRGERIPTPEDEPVAPALALRGDEGGRRARVRAGRPHGLDVVVARPFQHEGPGRDERFAVGSWTRQIARLEAEGGGTLLVGDLSAERDLTDVRDVCRAYRAAARPGRAGRHLQRRVRTGGADEARGRAARRAGARAGARRARPGAAAGRPTSRVSAATPSRLRAATGWTPEIPLEQTLADALDAARGRDELERAR